MDAPGATFAGGHDSGTALAATILYNIHRFDLLVINAPVRAQTAPRSARFTLASRSVERSRFAAVVPPGGVIVGRRT
jgi:hypothetical protein